MKKIILFLATVLTISANAQTPNWQWALNIGGNDYEAENSIATDASGNVYIAGNFRSSTITLGTFTLTNAGGGNEDMFIVKCDSNGNVLWANSAGAAGLDRVCAVTADDFGNSYVVGSFNSTNITFGTTTLPNSSTGYDMFFVKYDVSGNVLWATSAGGNSNEFANTVKTDALGNLYVGGYFYSSSLTFDTTTITNSGSPDAFLVKFNINGNALWAKSATGTASGSEIISSINTDASGNCYAAGYFNYGTTVMFDSVILTTAGNQDLFIVKYDSTGNVQWAKSEGGTGYESATSVAIDHFGNYIYVSGAFDSDTLTIGSTLLTTEGLTDMLLVKYNTAGNVQWVKSAGGNDNEFASAVATDVFGNSYVTGNFKSSIATFGSTILNNAGTNTQDIYLVKYDASGNVNWAVDAGGTGNDYGLSVATLPSGNCYVTGNYLSGTIAFGSTTLTNAGSNDIYLAKLNSPVVGITETMNENKLTVYPNPVNSNLTIHCSEDLQEIKIIDVLGSEVFRTTILYPASEFKILTSAFSNGIYFIQLQTKSRILKQKFIKN